MGGCRLSWSLVLGSWAGQEWLEPAVSVEEVGSRATMLEGGRQALEDGTCSIPRKRGFKALYLSTHCTMELVYTASERF